MAIDHLNDEQIQMYLDNTAHYRTAEIEKHLHSCPECREKYQLYQEIYRELAQDTFPALSADFSQNIMFQLIGKRKKSFFLNEFFMSGLVMFIAVSALLIWIQPWDLLQRIFSEIGGQVSVFVNSLKPLFGERFGLIVVICLILVIIEIIDYKLIRPRLRHLFHHG